MEVIGTIITIIVSSAVSVSITLLTFRHDARELKAQRRVELFAEYTHRYQDIMLHMPPELFSGASAFGVANAVPHMRLYFDLCSEEFYLNNKGFIDEDVWNMWVDGMQHNLQKTIYHDSWSVLAKEYNQPFCEFVEHKLLAKDVAPA